MAPAPRTARKKVVVLSGWYPSPREPLGGIFVKDQAECLARSFDVTVLLPRPVAGWRRGPALVRREENGVREWWVRRRALAGLPPFRRWRGAPDPAAEHARRFAAAAERAFRRYVAENGRPDVVHAHVVLPAGLAAARIGRRHGVPTVLTEHSGPFVVHMKTAAQRALVREALAGLDRVLAVSPALARVLNEFFPALPVEVLGNVVRTGFFTPAEPPPAPGGPCRFFCLALLYEGKGVQYLLEAAHLLVRRGVGDFEIVIGGEGDYRPRLEEMAGRLGLGGRCRFLGALNREQARHWMRQCDAFALPSLGETFCLVLAEAMACGRPVLSTRCGGPEYVVTPEAGVLVGIEDAAELAGAMEGFVRRRYAFDARAVRRSVCDRFGEEAFLRNLAAVYEEVCGRRPAPPPDRQAPPRAGAAGVRAPGPSCRRSQG